MFVVFGASGNTGSVVANALLDKGQKVRVVARDASKVAALRARGAEVVHADVTDAASVAKALEGATSAYFLVPPDAASPDLVARGRKIVDAYAAALEKSNVTHAVILSSVGAQVPTGTGPIVITHYAEETLAKSKRTHFTFLRAAYFMENLLGFAYPMKSDGVLPAFGGGETFAFPMVATRDIGRVAAAALLAPPQANDWIELSGPQEYSFTDAATEATKILGRTVKATALPLDALVPTLTGLGFSPSTANLYREMNEAFGKGTVHFEGKGRALRGTVTVGDVLKTLSS